MEEVLNTLRGCGPGVCTGIILVTSVIPVTLSVIFAVFAFSNPDNPAWYGTVTK